MDEQSRRELSELSGKTPLNRASMLKKRLLHVRHMLEQAAADRDRATDSIRKFTIEIAALEPQLAAAIADKGGALTLDDLCFAATSRCKCGAGLAYPEDGDVRGGWFCSKLLLEGSVADSANEHDGPFPFAFYSIKSEGQPSANGATTRP